MTTSSAIIRPACPSDSPALSKICLLTAAAGSSAESLHSIPELPGLIYALPYNQLDTTFGFVLVDVVQDNGGEFQEESIVGYILGTTDTKKLEQITELKWWPALRDKFPKGNDPSRKLADTRYISVIHSPHINPEDVTSRFPAHIHIDILPSHQRKSYGRALMASAISYLRDRGHSGLFVGLDPSNEAAKIFYDRLGFERIDKAGGEWWSLNFNNFCG